MSLAAYPNLDAYVGRVRARPAVRAALDAEGLK
jgi:glutathione S-transferase